MNISQNQNMLPVKVSFEKHMRRFQFDALSSLEQFKQQCYTMFKIPAHVSTFLMYMDDEGDWITVEQDDEWVEAKRHLLLANDANFTLRVRIVRHSNSGDNSRGIMGHQTHSSVCRLVHDFEEVITDAIHEGEKHLDMSSVQSFVDKVANEIKNKDSSTRKQVDSLVNQISVLLNDLFDHKGKKTKRQQEQQQKQEEEEEEESREAVIAADSQEGPSHPAPETLEQPAVPDVGGDHIDVVESPLEQPPLQIPPSRELQESWTFVEIQNHLMNQHSDSRIEEEEVEEEEDEIIDDVTEEYAPLLKKEEEVQQEEEEEHVQQTHAVPCCRFVEHVSFPECIQMSPDTTFTKTWKLQNTGKEQWPEGGMFNYHLTCLTLICSRFGLTHHSSNHIQLCLPTLRAQLQI